MRKKVILKTCNIVLDILIFICGLILLVSIYNDIQVKVFKKDYADFFGYSTFEVQTGSMKPAINVSDLIIVKKDKSPNVKDIITFKVGNDYITHRVVEVYKDTYVTKGDANNAKDDAITSDQIVGRVVKIIPNFGIIRKTFLNPLVLGTLLLTCFIISVLFNKKETSIGENKEKDEKSDETIKENVNALEEAKTDEISVKVVSETPKVDAEEAKAMLDSLENEEDMDKTIFFRKISVDSKDFYYDKSKEENETEQSIEQVIIEEINVDDKIEQLKKRNKKFDNLIEKVMFIKREEINKLISIINSDKISSNEPSIKDELLNCYIDGIYYNHCGDINTDYNMKNACSKIDEVLNIKAQQMITAYKGNDKHYATKVEKFKNIFIVITTIEYINKKYEDTDSKIVAYQKKLSKVIDAKNLNTAIGKIIGIQKSYDKIITDAIEKVKTNTFELDCNQLVAKKNMYGLVLKHNINFSKVYSDYIIDKTYDEGIVAEDKVLVAINMLYSKIAYNMINNNLKTNYLLYLPATLYEKENKLEKELKLLNDEACKNSVIFVVRNSVLIKYKQIITNIKKQGYRFAVFCDIEANDEKDQYIIGIADYVFLDKNMFQNSNIALYVNKSAIVIEDISSKVDILGGEQ